MAGPSIGTWVKVRNKSGRTTARVIANKFGGGHKRGEVITQSEYNAYKKDRAEIMSKGNDEGARKNSLRRQLAEFGPRNAKKPAKGLQRRGFDRDANNDD
jgi:hypothetical protein